ncbi:alpha/beta fold hydrolase [Mycoplasmopsis edwardii]|nr:alpha/beta hydrolase [Mycoplasmopsis edwardii]
MFKKEKIQILNETINVIYEDNQKAKVLFLHGFGSSTSFAQQVYNLANRDYDVVSFDFPGCGLSSANNEISIEYYQQIASAFVKQSGFDIKLVIGHSLGGASALYLLNNNLVSKALLAAPINHNILYDVVDETLSQTTKRLIRWLMPSTYDEAFESSDNLIYLNKNNYKENLSKIAQMFLNVSQKKLSIFKNMAKNQITNDFYLQNSIKPLYEANNDYQIISGINDRFVPLNSVKKIAIQLNKELTELENCGHALFFEQPELINDKINQIINSMK